jgi:hypothetical protein
MNNAIFKHNECLYNELGSGETMINDHTPVAERNEQAYGIRESEHVSSFDT